MTRRLSGIRRSCAAAISPSRRSSRPRRFRIPVSGSVTALRRSRCSANRRVERGGDVRGEDGRRVEQVRIHVSRLAADPDERAELARVRAEREPDRRPRGRAVRCTVELQHLADDAGIGLRTCAVDLVARQRSARRALRRPGRELRRRSELVPDQDLRRLDREHARKRRRGESRDLAWRAQAAEVDEQPRETGRSSVRRARSASASGARARTSGRSASTAPSGSARSDSMLRTPTTTRPARSGIASSEITPGSAGT